MDSSFSFERQGRPRLLKDFLIDESPSSSSNDFKSYPRKSCKFTSIKNLSNFRENNYSSVAAPRLLRSRSKAASAVHKASDIVMKFFPFASKSKIIIKSPSILILPRSISRKLSKKSSSTKDDHKNVTVKIKDILRWKSFRDLAMEEINVPMPLHFSSPNFTAEDDCSELGDRIGQLEENVAGDYMEDAIPKSKWQQLQFDDENDQHSPVSVLDSPFREDFHPSFATMERRKCMLMQRIEEFERLAKLDPVNDLEKEFPSRLDQENYAVFEETNYDEVVEEKAKQLLMHMIIKAMSAGKKLEARDEFLLLDFFRQEYLDISTRKQNDDAEDFDCELLRLAECWMNKGCGVVESSDWELLGKREASLIDMEKGIRWNKFEEQQQQEMGCDLEVAVLNDLLDELLADIVLNSN